MKSEYLPENIGELHRAKGLYLTFSTSPIAAQHTKIGYAGKGFAERAQQYRSMFNNQLEFWPIIELPTYQLRGMELLVMDAMYERYEGVMRRRSGEWFVTSDRQAVKALVIEVVTDRLVELGREELRRSLSGGEASCQKYLERQLHRDPRVRVTPSHLAACA